MIKFPISTSSENFISDILSFIKEVEKGGGRGEELEELMVDEELMEEVMEEVMEEMVEEEMEEMVEEEEAEMVEVEEDMEEERMGMSWWWRRRWWRKRWRSRW